MHGDDLVPRQQLERLADGWWRSVGTAPQMLMPRPLPAGWLRVRLRMSSRVRGHLELHADTGHGFRPADRLERAPVSDEADLDFYVRLPAPVRGLRLDPLDAAGDFRVDLLRVEPLSPARAMSRAVVAKFVLLWKHGLVTRCLGRALRLLARGEVGILAHKLFRGLSTPSIVGPDFANLNADYRVWRRRHRLTETDRRHMAETIRLMVDPPRFSVLMPVYNVAEKYLRRAIESVCRQTYSHWELCIADDASTRAETRRVLEEYAHNDVRIRVAYHKENRGIAATSNTALSLATGEYVALLDHDDELAEHALYRNAQAIVAERGLDMLYSDEDKIDLSGQHVEPFFKPDWSPELFLSCMYTCHLGVYRTALVREIGGFRSAFDSAQDYDLVLRLSERTARIAHIPDVLYHWRKLPDSTASRVAAKPEAPAAGRRALQEHLQRIGRPGTVEAGALPGLHRVRYAIVGPPRVSIVVASACRPVNIAGTTSYHMVRCVESIRQQSTYKHFDISLVHRREDMNAELGAWLDARDVKCVPYDGPFNWSRTMNLGVAAAWGDVLLFLNDDMEVRTADWIEALLEFAQRPEIGAVGGKLFFPDGTLQHAGVVVADCTPRHAFYRFRGSFPGYFSGNLVHRNVSAVTGACLMTRANLFREVGGFREDLPLNYNDIDYCLKVITSGKRVVYTPYAELTHYESSTKSGTYESELIAFQNHWRERWPADPCYNPNLSSQFGDYRIDLR